MFDRAAPKPELYATLAPSPTRDSDETDLIANLANARS
jgi:hypothetical protein